MLRTKRERGSCGGRFFFIYSELCAAVLSGGLAIPQNCREP